MYVFFIYYHLYSTLIQIISHRFLFPCMEVLNVKHGREGHLSKLIIEVVLINSDIN